MANSNKIVDLAALTRFKTNLDALLDEYAKSSDIAVIGQNADAANNRSLALQNGDIPANKATCDGSGNNIASTYAKKSDIPASATVDSALSTTSTNPVQNKVITTKINQINADISDIIDGSVTVGAATKAAQDGTGNSISGTYVKQSASYRMLYNSTVTIFGASNKVHIIQYGTSGAKILIVCGKTSSITDGSSVSWSINTTIRTYGFNGSNIGIVALQANAGGLDQYRNGVCAITNSTSSISLRNNTNTTSSFNFIAMAIV